VDAVLPKAEAAARRAIQLDPRSADAYAGLGTVQGWTNQKLLDAEQSFKRALSLDPLNPDALHYYSQIIAATGRLKEALAMREQLRSLEPLVPVFSSVTDRILWAAGENDKALALAQALPSNNGQRASDIARTYAAMGRYEDAANAVLTAPRELFAPGAIETAARLLRAAPAPAPREEFPYLATYSFVYLYAGLPERALEFNEHNADAGYEVAVTTALIWHPDYRLARKTERFKPLVRKVGLVEYWRARGWPEFCHPTTGDDFVCD
jgi:tetratricopeptide (TPR) repeat protein